jgi:hypothetical protein
MGDPPWPIVVSLSPAALQECSTEKSPRTASCQSFIVRLLVLFSLKPSTLVVTVGRKNDTVTQLGQTGAAVLNENV